MLCPQDSTSPDLPHSSACVAGRMPPTLWHMHDSGARSSSCSTPLVAESLKHHNHIFSILISCFLCTINDIHIRKQVPYDHMTGWVQPARAPAPLATLVFLQHHMSIPLCITRLSLRRVRTSGDHFQQKIRYFAGHGIKTTNTAVSAHWLVFLVYPVPWSCWQHISCRSAIAHALASIGFIEYD